MLIGELLNGEGSMERHHTTRALNCPGMASCATRPGPRCSEPGGRAAQSLEDAQLSSSADRSTS